MINQVRSDHRSVSGQKIQNAWRHSRLLEDLHQHRAADDRLLGWFHDHRIAGHNSGRCHSAENRHRKIPWCNDKCDASRPIVMIAILSGNTLCELRTPETSHLLRIKPAKIDGLANVSIGFIPRFADLENFDRGEFVAPAFHDVRRALQQARPFFERRPAPLAKCLARAFDSALGLGNPCFRPVTHNLVRSAWIHRGRQLIGPNFFAADDEWIFFAKAFAHFAQCALHLFLTVFISEIHKRRVSVNIAGGDVKGSGIFAEGQRSEPAGIIPTRRDYSGFD